jgi:NAD(P)-dependent dehydrogenase (short-subunit alcohol dehydrogenase family)
MKKVCLITGVGPGTGSALVRRFAASGYRIIMIARDAARLAAIEKDVTDAHAYPCDVANEAQLQATLEAIESAWGFPHIPIHNAVAAARGEYLDIEPKAMDVAWRVNVMALMHLARWSSPAMIDRGEGAIVCTGNTAAYRGKAHFAGFAPTKAAQRILMESIARASGPKGIHAAFLAIDAVIDLEWTRKAFAGQPDDFFCKPEDIAENCFALAHQPRSAWTFDMVIRPFGETW